MIELLKEYSIGQILILLAMIALAVKEIVEFKKWIKINNQEKFEEGYDRKQKDIILEKYKETNEEMQKRMANCYSSIEGKIDGLAEDMSKRMDGMEEQLKILADSDMHDIKSWIVEKHHIYIKKGWIDDFSMDIVEKRYSDYVKEGGNSYIHTLVEELRTLPHKPPENK